MFASSISILLLKEQTCWDTLNLDRSISDQTVQIIPMFDNSTMSDFSRFTLPPNHIILLNCHSSTNRYFCLLHARLDMAHGRLAEPEQRHGGQARVRDHDALHDAVVLQGRADGGLPVPSLEIS